MLALIAFLDGVNLYWVLGLPLVLSLVLVLTGWRRERNLVLLWCLALLCIGAAEVAIHERVIERTGEALPTGRYGLALLGAAAFPILLRLFPEGSSAGPAYGGPFLRSIWIAQPLALLAGVIAWALGQSVGLSAGNILTAIVYGLLAAEIIIRARLRWVKPSGSSANHQRWDGDHSPQPPNGDRIDS